MSMTGRYLQLTPAQLEAVIAEPELAAQFAFPETETGARALDIDRSWHIIHFLLNGQPWEGDEPLANAVLGGAELPHTDAGYGPFRYLAPHQVRELSSALRGIPFEVLWSRLDSERTEAAEIYPGRWNNDLVERQYVSHHYEALCSFMATAGESSNAVLLHLS